MPSSPLLTSSDVAELVRKEDWKVLLDAVLAAVCRDGGQYTILAGYQASIELALHQIPELYRKNAALSGRIGQLVRQRNE